MAVVLRSLVRTLSSRVGVRAVGGVSIRTFATEEDAAGRLAHVLSSEAKLEKKNLEPLDKSVKKFLEQSFTITNNPGTNRFTLVRKEGDAEKVTIIVDAGNPEWVEEDGGEQEEGSNADEARDTHFFYTTVVVQKPGAANMLVFETFIGEVSGVDIRNVHYAPAGADLDTLGSKTEYTGPVYDELDEELRASFEDYLTSLGVDFEFAAAAFKMADHKENSEYAAWLSNVAEYLQ